MATVPRHQGNFNLITSFPHWLLTMVGFFLFWIERFLATKTAKAFGRPWPVGLLSLFLHHLHDLTGPPTIYRGTVRLQNSPPATRCFEVFAATNFPHFWKKFHLCFFVKNVFVDKSFTYLRLYTQY
jgi:hypothetical protein